MDQKQWDKDKVCPECGEVIPYIYGYCSWPGKYEEHTCPEKDEKE